MNKLSTVTLWYKTPIWTNVAVLGEAKRKGKMIIVVTASDDAQAFAIAKAALLDRLPRAELCGDMVRIAHHDTFTIVEE